MTHTRYLVVIRGTWSAGERQQWDRYAATRLRIRPETATRIAQYGYALTQRYEIHGPPQTGADVDRAVPDTRSVQVLSRSVWDPEAASLCCAADAVKHGPHVLLMTHVDTKFTRADNFRIYATVALYPDGTAAPTALRRTYGEYDQRADDAIARLVSATTRTAKLFECLAPIVAIDYDLSDDVIHKLAGDEHPFAAAVEAHWWHPAIAALVVPAQLLGNSPFELFSERGDHIYCYPRDGAGGAARAIEVIPMQYRGQPDSGLYFVLVPGAALPYFVVRPPAATYPGVHQQMPAAAAMAQHAATLHGIAPLAPLGVEFFRASVGEEQRWLRHMTIVQAAATFVVASLNRNPSGAS